jgi:hypothetical protein
LHDDGSEHCSASYDEQQCLTAHLATDQHWSGPYGPPGGASRGHVGAPPPAKPALDRAIEIIAREDALASAQRASSAATLQDITNGSFKLISKLKLDTLKKAEKEAVLAAFPDAVNYLPRGRKTKNNFKAWRCPQPRLGWAIRKNHKAELLVPAAVLFLAWLYNVGVTTKSQKHDAFAALELMKIAGTTAGKLRMLVLGESDDAVFINAVVPFSFLELPRYWTIKAFFGLTTAKIEQAVTKARGKESVVVADADD